MRVVRPFDVETIVQFLDQRRASMVLCTSCLYVIVNFKLSVCLQAWHTNFYDIKLVVSGCM